MFRTTRRRFTVNALLVVFALVFSAACSDDCDGNQDSGFSWALINRTSPTPRTIPPGTAATPPLVTATATLPPPEYRYATVEPVRAVFDQSTFSTTYTLKITGGIPEGASVRWTGPNCGTVTNEFSGIPAAWREDTTVHAVRFVWTHPHPPCGNTTDHRDATIVATFAEGSGYPGGTPRITTVCTYPGSESGTGPACQVTQ